MTLDEAIIHAEKVAEENEEQYKNCPMKYDGHYVPGKTASKCAEEYRQLVEWLKELKQYRQNEEDGCERCSLEATTWIFMSDRLPDEEGSYLVSCKNGKDVSVCMGYYKPAYKSFDRTYAIAWMPLPNPYEPQESEET